MNVAFGTDEHTALTDAVRAELERRGHTVIAVDDGQWVEVGRAVGKVVASGRGDTGVLFCWTGTGASIAANKVPGVRAALCADLYTARMSREHNDANVLVLGGRLMGADMASDILQAWLETDFAAGRHARRVAKIADVEVRHAGDRAGRPDQMDRR